MKTRGDMLWFAIAFGLMRARKLVRGLRQGLSEDERYLIADDVVLGREPIDQVALLRRHLENLLEAHALCDQRRIASAIIGATLFPIILKLCHTVGWNLKLSGNPWRRAASLTVITLGSSGCIGRTA